GEERRQRRYTIAHVAPNQQSAIAVYIIAEWQLADVAAIEGEQDAAQKTAKLNSAGAFVGGEAVGLTLRIIEFFLARLHIHVSVGQLAKIDLRARDVEIGHRALHRHIAQNQGWQSFGSKAIHRIHGDAVSMSVDQLFVDPITAALRQLFYIQLARRKHYLANCTVDFIAVDVNVGKVVVGTNFLYLA